ncbi:MAG: TIGR02594 family protein [Herbaspirillum sp.]
MEDSKIRKIQQALVDKGFVLGDVDGIWGRRSIAAVKAFQAQQRLEVDGIVGPQTWGALFPTPAGATAGDRIATPEPLLPWLEEARHLIGTKEILGPRSNPAILDWAHDLDAHYPGDDVPWCGLFVGHCIATTMPDEVLPTNVLAARAWQKFGDSTTPRLGAVMVFWRGARDGWQGHVGLYAGEDTRANAFRILGGNQSDSVCYTWIGKDRLLSARWPRTASSLGGGTAVVHVDMRGELSTREA